MIKISYSSKFPNNTNPKANQKKPLIQRPPLLHCLPLHLDVPPPRRAHDEGQHPANQFRCQAYHLLLLLDMDLQS